MRKRQILRQDRLHGGIIILVATVGVEQAEGCVVSKTVVYREVLANAPRILNVYAEPLHVLSEAPIVCRQALARRRIGCAIGNLMGGIIEVRRKRSRVCNVERRVVRQHVYDLAII